MLFPRRDVDAKTAAQRIERRRRSGEFLPRDQQRIQRAREWQLLMARRRQFGIQKLHVERGVMDHQLRIGDEIQKIAGDGGEFWFVAQEIIAQPMHLERLGRHEAFWIEILVIAAPGRQMVEQFHRADFHDSVALRRVQPGGFGIQHNFTHHAP